MFGHSNPIITKAMHEAIDNGYALGGVNAYEGRLANLFTSRFQSIDKIRFSNSGTSIPFEDSSATESVISQVPKL